jgi:hypothetical protein
MIASLKRAWPVNLVPLGLAVDGVAGHGEQGDDLDR